jgi:hypothetical protein
MTDEFFCGVMSSLAIVYQADAETIAEEIVRATGASELLRVAKVNDDPWLTKLRKTATAVRVRNQAATRSARAERQFPRRPHA